MRFKDFLITLLISTITSLIVIWTLINAGIIQTQQQYPQLYIKQTHSGTMVGMLNEADETYEAYIERIPIENVSDKTTMRFLHISLEANVTNYDPNKKVAIDSFQLKNQHTGKIIAEKNFDFELISYTFLAIDVSISPFTAYYIRMNVTGTYDFTLTYDLIVVQELLT